MRLNKLFKTIVVIVSATSNSIVVCISPLTSVMVDQHEKFIIRGLRRMLLSALYRNNLVGLVERKNMGRQL